MDAADQFVYEKQAQVCDHVLAEVEARSTENIVAKSSHYLYRRISDGVRSLHVLSEHTEHDWAVDCVSILRTMYDAMLQLLWLLHNPPDRERRAAMYLEYFYVEKLRILAKIDGSGTDLASLLAESENRPQVDKDLRHELTTYGPQFLTVKGRQRHREQLGDEYLLNPRAYRDYWYPSDIHLAEEVRYAREFGIFQKVASAAVHASLWALLRGPRVIGVEDGPFCGMRFCLRGAGAVAKALDIPLTDSQAEETEHAKANIFNRPEVDP